MQYNALVLDHFHQPRNVGEFAPEDSNILKGSVGKVSMGDMLQLELQIDQQNTVVAAKFKAYGNPFVIALMSYLTDILPGQSLEEAGNISRETLIEQFQLPQTKIYVAVLVEDVLKAALGSK